MKFMILIKADKDSEAGILPDEKLFTEMGKFNEELAKAGVLVARVKFVGDKRIVTDGPFPETKELIAGY